MPELPASPTPAAAPAGAAPSAASTPAGAAPQPGGGSLANEFEELDRIAATPKEPARPDEKQELPPEEKPKEEPAKPGEVKLEPEKFGKAAELRTAYEKTKTRLSEVERELAEYKTGKAKAEDPELPRVRETLAQREKRLAELENEIKFTNYEKSSEYQDKHQKPMENAYKAAYADIGELVITDANGEARQAKHEDFNSLLTMSVAEASTKAKELFGDAAGEVMAHRRRIVQMARDRREAIESYQKQGSEREKQHAEQSRQQQEALTQTWNGINEELPKKYPDWFAPKEGDVEGNKFLEDGMKLADLAFHGIGSVPPEQLVKIQAMVRTRAAAFGRTAHRLSQANAKIAALQAEIEAFRNSGPGGEELPTGGSKSGELSANDELDQIAGLRK